MFTGFKAGDRYEDYALPFLMSEPIPENDVQGEFWPDGRPNRFNRPQALTLTGCFKAGAITCTNCHVAHGSRTTTFSLKVDITRAATATCCARSAIRARRMPAPPASAQSPLARITSRSPDATREPRAVDRRRAVERTRSTRPTSAGSRCINCHMSDVNWRLLIRRRDHTFQAPVPETTAAFGVPNACTTCHDDKTPEWAAGQMDAWWGDGARRQKSATLATRCTRRHRRRHDRAGAGPLAVDRSQGALIRASAPEYIGRLAGARVLDAAPAASQTSTERGRPAARPAPRDGKVEPRVVGALIGAASDPEPMVRAAAVRTLGSLGQRDDRVLAVLMARLVDDTRVVRVRAAEALLALGVVTAAGRAGEALARAQQDLATSLRSFPESAPMQPRWPGWTRSAAKTPTRPGSSTPRSPSSPSAARPYVINGVLAARAGRFSDALASWKTARDRDPATPNIDQMIDEAKRRLAAPPPK